MHGLCLDPAVCSSDRAPWSNAPPLMWYNSATAYRAVRWRAYTAQWRLGQYTHAGSTGPEGTLDRTGSMGTPRQRHPATDERTDNIIYVHAMIDRASRQTPSLSSLRHTHSVRNSVMAASGLSSFATTSGVWRGKGPFCRFDLFVLYSGVKLKIRCECGAPLRTIFYFRVYR